MSKRGAEQQLLGGEEPEDDKKSSSVATVLKTGGALAVILTLMCSQAIFISLAKKHSGEGYNGTTVLLLNESLKFLISLVMFVISGQKAFTDGGPDGWQVIAKYSIYFCGPALIYMMMNNVNMIGIGILGASSFMILNNLKIGTTAIMMQLVMKTIISKLQWIALLILALGTTVSQLNTHICDDAPIESDAAIYMKFVGIMLGVVSTLLSASAGVYTEYFFKSHGTWTRAQPWQLQNAQMYFWGLLLNGGLVIYREGGFPAGGLFTGWSRYSYFLLASQVALGISVGWMMRVLNNLIKVYTNCMAVVIVSLISIPVFGDELEIKFLVSIGLIAASIYLYYGKLTKD